jgi:hypothetical protein
MKEGSVSKRIDRPLSHRPDQELDQGEVLGMARRERSAPPEAAAPHRWLGRAAEWGVATAATREKRIALLIGNKDYKSGVGSLTNPLNDVRIVGEALKSVGFEVLNPVENAQRSAMLIAIHAFAAKLVCRIEASVWRMGCSVGTPTKHQRLKILDWCVTVRSVS